MSLFVLRPGFCLVLLVGKLLSSFVLPWLRVRANRFLLGFTRSARRRTRAVLRALRQRVRQHVRQCGDCVHPEVATSRWSCTTCLGPADGWLGCARQRARASPLRPARERRGAPLPAADTAVRIRARAEGETPSPPLLLGARSQAGSLGGGADGDADGATARWTVRQRANSELERQEEKELVEQQRGLDNTVPYETALFELVTAALLRGARPVDSLVLLAEMPPTSHAAAAPSDPIHAASSALSNVRRDSSSSPRERRAALRAQSDVGARAGGVRALDVWEQAQR